MTRPDWPTVYSNLSNGSWTIEEASRQMAMSARSIATNVQVAARMGDPIARQALTVLRSGVAGPAMMATGGRVALQAIATRLGIGLGTLVLGTAATVVLVIGGIYLATRSPDKPALTISPAADDSVADDSGAAAEQFGVFLVADDVMVGLQSEIAARRLCDTRTWGIDCDTTLGQAATITLKMGPYETLEEAIAAYCATLQPATIRLDQLSDATWAVALDGAEHRIQNAPGC